MSVIELAGGVPIQERAARPISRQMPGQVPGSGKLILAEPP